MLERGWDSSVIMKYIFYYFFGFFWPAPQEPKKPKLSEFHWVGLNLKKNKKNCVKSTITE